MKRNPNYRPFEINDGIRYFLIGIFYYLFYSESSMIKIMTMTRIARAMSVMVIGQSLPLLISLA